MLKELYDADYLFVRDGRWAGWTRRAPATRNCRCRRRGSEILRGRLRRLPGRLLETLTALAVWGRQASVETLAEMAGLEPGQAEESEAILERRRLVVRRGGSASLSHEEIAAAALEVAPPELVTRLHACAATFTAEAARRGGPGSGVWRRCTPSPPAT